MQHHQPFKKFLSVFDVLIPALFHGDRSGTLTDSSGDVRGAELAQLLPTAKHVGPVVAGFDLDPVQELQHLTTWPIRSLEVC
ncbi:MAG: hypothetical protein Q8N13_22565 [Acidovorax sp.]|nr:hypothetical protein [Acidovorax sp.]